MKTTRVLPVAISGLFAVGSLGLGTSLLGCAAPSSAGSCTLTPFISPTSITLDHTVAGNSQVISGGYGPPVIGSASACPGAIPAGQYQWSVSDNVDATITSAIGPQATVSCVNAAMNPIIISTSVASYAPGSTTPTYVPSGLPTATLTCK
jgi:hypothetical protein